MKYVKFLLLPALLTATSVFCQSKTDLLPSLETLIQQHELISLVDSELDAAKQQIEVEKAAWYPTISVSGKYGRERIFRDIGSNANNNPSSISLLLRQKVWDFGKVSTAIDKAEQNAGRKQLERNLQEQNLMLAGIEAYIGLKSSYRVAAYAAQSERNIKTQAKLEDTRISSGKGYTADALQAKAQLAGAQARRVISQQTLASAKNRFQAVFRQSPPTAKQLQNVTEPVNLLPAHLDFALDALATSNPDVLRDKAGVSIAQADIALISAREWMPSLDVVLQTRKERNQDGISGDRNNNAIYLQFNWDYSLGSKASYSVKTAVATMAAQQYKADYTFIKAKEETQNAWSDLIFARQRAAFLNDQAGIAKQFLNLARKERELGRRSLIDVLAGETSLINAQSDHSAAQADVITSAYRTLRSMGQLSLSTLKK